MNETPDLSKIVNLIMQNPSLIEQISKLANPKEETSDTPTPRISEETAAAPSAVQESVHTRSIKDNRSTLINAMKPYLSEHRQNALDSMSSILEVIEVMVKK